MVVRVYDGAPAVIVEAIEKALAEPNAFSEEFDLVEFGDWAELRVYVPEPAQSVITPAYMEAFLELQRQIYQLAALGKAGEANASLLTDSERKLFQVNVRVTGGSSNYEADLKEVLTDLGRKMLGRLTPKQTMIVILGLAFVVATTYGWSAWLDHTKAVKLEELKGKDHQAALQSIQFSTEENNKTVRRVVEALEKQGDAGQKALDAIASVNEALLRAAAQTPKSQINGVEITSSEAQILRTPTRKKAEANVHTKQVKVVDINTSDPFDLQIILEDVETQSAYPVWLVENGQQYSCRHIRQRAAIPNSALQGWGAPSSTTLRSRAPR